jgi:hypothetical protein
MAEPEITDELIAGILAKRQARAVEEAKRPRPFLERRWVSAGPRKGMIQKDFLVYPPPPEE